MRAISHAFLGLLVVLLALSLPLIAQAQPRPLPSDLVPIAASDIPRFGRTYWSIQRYPWWPPLPFNWLSASNVQLYVSPSRGTNAIFVGDLDIDYARRAAEAEALRLAVRAATEPLAPEEYYETGGPLGLSYSTNDFWLEPVSIANNLFNVILHGTTNGSNYLIISTEAVNPAATNTWLVEGSLQGGTNGATSFALGNATRSNSLFIRARACDECAATALPLWWQLAHFGVTGVSPSSDLDGDGVSNLAEYLNGTEPNTIAFFLTTTNQHANASLTPVHLHVTAGVPAALAVAVDSTNRAAAEWMSYCSSVLVNLGATQGWHQVSVGLRGRMETSQQTWHTIRVKLLLTPPVLALTNPVSFTVDRPVVQLQGYGSEQLASLSYELTNAAGLLTNQAGQVLDQYYDANNLAYTTNYFQCFDVPLTNGANTITLRATDFAGNTAITNLTLMLDYSARTNPPAITLGWPADGTRVGSPAFTWRGWIDDPTAQVAAQIVDTNGVTNIVNGRVGRQGDFWIENVALPQATNLLTLVVNDATGRESTTNLTVLRSEVTLSVDSVSLMSESAGGRVNDPACAVWVNGIQGANNGDGTWTATGLHLTLDDTAVQARAIPNSDNGGAGSGTPSPGGHGAFAADLGNPDSAQATDAEAQVLWPDGATHSRAIHYQYLLDVPDSPPYGRYTADRSVDWQEEEGGTGVERVTLTPPPGHWLLPYAREYTWEPGRWPDLGDGIEVYTDPTVTYTQSVVAPFDGAVGEHWWYSGDMEYVAPDGWCSQYWHEHNQITLVAGGAPGDNGLALYGISGGVNGWVAGFPYVSYYDIPPENIQFGALGSPDTNGFLLAAVQKRTTVDVTPTVSGLNYGQISALVTPYHFIIETVATTPTNRARSTLGVGEQVKLKLAPALPSLAALRVTWSTTAGSVSPWSGNETTLTAPSNAGPATVRMFYYGSTGNVVKYTTNFNFTVIEPTGVDHAITVSTTGQYIPSGVAGAWMRLNVTIGPTTVSFYRVKVLEVGEDASNITGYFLSHPPLSHKVSGADVWHPVDYANLVDSAAQFDTCTYAGNDPQHLPPPWAPGGFRWNIPARWKVGDAGATNTMPGWHQDFLLGADGTFTITKFQTNVVTRTVNNLITPDL